VVRGVVVVEFTGGIEGGRVMGAEKNRVGREPELQVFFNQDQLKHKYTFLAKNFTKGYHSVITYVL
jgi:hypothetical protein